MIATLEKNSATTVTPYTEYCRADLLLALQHPRSTAQTEHGFIIVNQVKELLFKLLHTELTAARGQIEADGVADALWTLRRAHRVQHLLLSSWDVLAAITPAEFAEFRDVLGDASGHQSSCYRRLEFLLGNKRTEMAEVHRGGPDEDAVFTQLREPSLYDEVLRLLARRGLDVPQEALDAVPGRPYRAHPAVEAAWRQIYLRRGDHHELYLLAEALMETSHLFARWRSAHVLLVERLLGGKPGTGGTSGVGWLRAISEHRFFPELWSVRSQL